MQARYKGTCKACGKSIEVGQEITWNRAIKGSTRHTTCAEKTGIAIAIGSDGIAHKVADVYGDVLVAEASAPLEAKLAVMDGDAAIAHARESGISFTPIPDLAPKRTRKPKTPKADVVAKASDALSRVPQNAAWYDVLTAILPHVSRVLLVGPPATGKSTTAMKVSGAKYRVTMTETTSREDLIGMFHLIDGETKWIDGPVTSAMRNGEPILVDEIDRYSPEAASLLYALIDDKPHLSLPNGDMLYASDGYKMIMTSNEGLDTLPVAVQDRIECVLMASEPHEDAISELPEALRNVTTCYYRSLSKVSIKLPTTVRRMKTLNLLLTNGLNPKLAASIVFGQSAEILSVLASMENSVSA